MNIADEYNQIADELTYETWREALEEGDLLGQKCVDCGRVTATPTAVCGQCGEMSLRVVSLPTEGTIYSETTIAVAPRQFEGQYQVVIVDIGETRIMAHTEAETIEIGDEVQLLGVLKADDKPAPIFG